MSDTTEIRANDGIATLINVFEVEPAKQQELVDLLNEGTEKVAKTRPGFVSVTVLASLDGSRVVNYAQWESPEALRAVQGDAEMGGYARRTAELAKAAPAVYRVAAVHHA
ncbi:antibiotic biosynthesis monooxygenase family protein [Streptomyces sp. NPDC021020]|uniref:antibiotic biosynthesis monooxygenase family protein n=1 Tax=Streptomyces sp. NPDC021020 TaxID=3365109 RepID=UPI0037BA7D8A